MDIHLRNPFPHKTYYVPAADVTQVDNSVHLRSPYLKLSLPGGHSGEGYYDEVWTVQLVLVIEIVKECNCLDSFAQSHLVS